MIIGTKTTGTDGAYSFTGITPGSYTIEETVKAGWSQTYPAGNVYTVVVSDAGLVTVTKADQKTTVASTAVDFGNVPIASISGIKFGDLDGDGSKDNSETGLSGWTINLKKDGTIIGTKTTGTDGAYSFTGITPGSYTIEETVKAGWSQTYPAGNVYTVVVSDAGLVTVTKADQKTTVASTAVDFGNVPIASISGIKSGDLDGDGSKDNSETGLSGWTINLKKDGTIIGTKTTGTDGAYSFTGITPGSYTIEETVKAGWSQTYPAGNVYTVVVSDTGLVTVTKADQKTTVDRPP